MIWLRIEARCDAPDCQAMKPFALQLGENNTFSIPEIKTIPDPSGWRFPSNSKSGVSCPKHAEAEAKP